MECYEPDPEGEPSEEATDAPTDESIEEEEENTEEPDRQPGPVGNCPSQNGQYPVFLADGAHCDRYWVCDWGRPILMYCPATLHFNTRINVCDWPRDAGCTA